MIITGYQGIGKSTVAATRYDIIDLESTNFWKVDKVTGTKTRPDDWYVYYCQLAMDLSSQGYIVFVSSHQQVRDYLKENHDAKNFCVIFPALRIKDDWLKRLKDRYEASGLEKDLNAYIRALNSYETDIQKFYDEAEAGYYHRVITLADIDYDLAKVIYKLEQSFVLAVAEMEG